MKSNRATLLGGAALGLAGLIAAGGYALNAASTPNVAIDADDIGGVVMNPSGQPEAGVWVIAETHDLDVRYIKIVVTDDQGRFVVPDLPSANYSVWVRGYGLVDSDKITSKPGATLNLAAKIAPSELAAAQYYPAAYWYSMMKIPREGRVRPGQEPSPRTSRRKFISTPSRAMAAWAAISSASSRRARSPRSS